MKSWLEHLLIRRLKYQWIFEPETFKTPVMLLLVILRTKNLLIRTYIWSLYNSSRKWENRRIQGHRCRFLCYFEQQASLGLTTLIIGFHSFSNKIASQQEAWPGISRPCRHLSHLLLWACVQLPLPFWMPIISFYQSITSFKLWPHAGLL